MSKLIPLILVAVVAFSLGMATAPLWLMMMRTSTTILTPFFVLSVAVLVVSIAFAIQTIRRPPR